MAYLPADPGQSPSPRSASRDPVGLNVAERSDGRPNCETLGLSRMPTGDHRLQTDLNPALRIRELFDKILRREDLGEDLHRHISAAGLIDPPPFREHPNPDLNNFSQHLPCMRIENIRRYSVSFDARRQRSDLQHLEAEKLVGVLDDHIRAGTPGLPIGLVGHSIKRLAQSYGEFYGEIDQAIVQCEGMPGNFRKCHLAYRQLRDQYEMDILDICQKVLGREPPRNTVVMLGLPVFDVTKATVELRRHEAGRTTLEEMRAQYDKDPVSDEFFALRLAVYNRLRSTDYSWDDLCR